jgi:hypothetical protein
MLWPDKRLIYEFYDKMTKAILKHRNIGFTIIYLSKKVPYVNPNE